MQFNVPVRADSELKRVGDLLGQGATVQMSSADSIGYCMGTDHRGLA